MLNINCKVPVLSYPSLSRTLITSGVTLGSEPNYMYKICITQIDPNENIRDSCIGSSILRITYGHRGRRYMARTATANYTHKSLS